MDAICKDMITQIFFIPIVNEFSLFNVYHPYIAKVFHGEFGQTGRIGTRHARQIVNIRTVLLHDVIYVRFRHDIFIWSHRMIGRAEGRQHHRSIEGFHLVFCSSYTHIFFLMKSGHVSDSRALSSRAQGEEMQQNSSFRVNKSARKRDDMSPAPVEIEPWVAQRCLLQALALLADIVHRPDAYDTRVFANTFGTAITGSADAVHALCPIDDPQVEKAVENHQTVVYAHEDASVVARIQRDENRIFLNGTWHLWCHELKIDMMRVWMSSPPPWNVQRLNEDNVPACILIECRISTFRVENDRVDAVCITEVGDDVPIFSKGRLGHRAQFRCFTIDEPTSATKPLVTTVHYVPSLVKVLIEDNLQIFVVYVRMFEFDAEERNMDPRVRRLQMRLLMALLYTLGADDDGSASNNPRFHGLINAFFSTHMSRTTRNAIFPRGHDFACLKDCGTWIMEALRLGWCPDTEPTVRHAFARLFYYMTSVFQLVMSTDSGMTEYRQLMETVRGAASLREVPRWLHYHVVCHISCAVCDVSLTAKDAYLKCSLCETPCFVCPAHAAAFSKKSCCIDCMEKRELAIAKQLTKVRLVLQKSIAESDEVQRQKRDSENNKKNLDFAKAALKDMQIKYDAVRDARSELAEECLRRETDNSKLLADHDKMRKERDIAKANERKALEKASAHAQKAKDRSLEMEKCAEARVTEAVARANASAAEALARADAAEAQAVEMTARAADADARAQAAEKELARTRTETEEKASIERASQAATRDALAAREKENDALVEFITSKIETKKHDDEAISMLMETKRATIAQLDELIALKKEECASMNERGSRDTRRAKSEQLRDYFDRCFRSKDLDETVALFGGRNNRVSLLNILGDACVRNIVDSTESYLVKEVLRTFPPAIASYEETTKMVFLGSSEA